MDENEVKRELAHLLRAIIMMGGSDVKMIANTSTQIQGNGETVELPHGNWFVFRLDMDIPESMVGIGELEA